MIRSIYPTDILSSLLSPRMLPPNQAIARHRLEPRSALSLDALLEHWVPFKGRRHTWVSLEEGQIRHIASAKGGAVPTVWQVDCLQVEDDECCGALLDRMSADAAGRGVRKLFLRLPADSPLVDGAKQAGFSCYTKDYIYHYDEGSQHPLPAPGPYSVRPRLRDNDYVLFDLYNAAVPPQVRAAEGITLEEWRESRGQGSWLEHHREFLLEADDRVVGWLQVTAAREACCFEIISHRLEDEGLAWLLDYAIGCAGSRGPVVCTAAAFQGQLQGLLEGAGFERVAEYSAMVKDIAVKVEEPQFVPIRA